MDPDSLDNYFSCLPVVNTVEDRLKEDSLIHTFSCRNTTRESTKKLNKYLKTHRILSYSDYVKCKKDILIKSANNLDVSDDSELSDSDYKTFYSSFNNSTAGTSKDIHDELYVWSFIEKKGLKTVEPVDEHDDSIWEPTIDIHIEDGQVEGQAKFNGSLKAAGVLPIKNKLLRKKTVKKICYNTRNSSSKNCINNNNNSNSINVPNGTPEKHEEEVENITSPASKVLRNKKINGVKRNLKSAINNASSQVSETGEADFTCDFIPEDFQAQSTQIFSDTVTDNSILTMNSQTRLSNKFSSNHANNQPRDSGIEEDSRDGNSTHQNIENNERKVVGASKNKEQNNLSGESNDSKKKQSLKIIGDQTLTKKYKIIANNNNVLQPIVEEKNITPSEQNNKSNADSNHDSESDFKSIESGDEEESNDGEKTKESFDEYHDVADDNNALSSEDEKVSQPEKSVIANGRETDVDSDSQDSNHDRERPKNEFTVRSTSPWLGKQYKDLKRLRLLNTDSEIDLNESNETNAVADHTVSTKTKKTSKKHTNKFEKASENHIKSKKKKSFVNGKLIKDSDLEISNPQITNENSEENVNINEHSTKQNESSANKTKRFVKNDVSSNSKLHNDDRDSSESDTADNHKSLKKIKKLRHKKKRHQTNNSDLSSSREQSYERQTQHGLTDIVNSYKDLHSSQSVKDEDNKEEIHQSCVEDDALSDLHVGKSTKLKKKSLKKNSNLSQENIDAILSKNNSSRRDSSASSIKEHLTTQLEKSNKLKNETSATSDDEKDSEDEKTMSEHQKDKLQKLKKMDLMASDESSVSETQLENADLENKDESLSRKNERTNEKIIEKSYESNDEGTDNWKTTETILSRKSSPSDESDKEDDALPTQQAQKKIQQMKRLNFDDSSESEDSETETISINRHKSQFIKSETAIEQINETSEKVNRACSDDESDEDDIMPETEKNHLQQLKKMDLMASDESEDSDDHQVLKDKSRKISDEKTKLNSAKGQTFNNKSKKTHRLSDEDGSDEEAKISENQVKHLQKKKKMDRMHTDDSEDSEADHISKSRSRKISDEKIKSEDSEDENETSKKKVKLHKKSNANSDKEGDSDSVHYDSDNVDIKEHKVILPDEAKHTNLLDHLNESNLESFNAFSNDVMSHEYSQSKDVDGLENNDDQEIDNIVPVEVSKRMQQLKRLNLYEDNDSSDSDESLRNNRNNRNISQISSSISRKERDDSSSDEKDNINVEPPISTDKLNGSELNDTKESIQDKAADEEANDERNMNVIIPETQESEDLDNIQSQEMFTSLENLAEFPSQVPAIPKSGDKKSTPTKPERKKITEIAELAEQEELTKSSLVPTITLNDISDDDEEIFLIDVPKHVFDQDVLGKKLVVSNDTLTIGESNYEAFEKGTSPIMSCVMKSSIKKKFKIVNMKPLFSIVARRKKDVDDFNENTEIENVHKKSTTTKHRHYTQDNDPESADEVCNTQSTSTKKSKSKTSKLPQKDKLHSLSATTLKDGKIAKKKTAKNKKINVNNLINDIETLEEQTGHKIANTSQIFRKKLYASDHEMKDIVDSNATDEFSTNANIPSKKSKKTKKVKDTKNTGEKLVAGVSSKESPLKNRKVDNEITSVPNDESKGEGEVALESKSKTKVKKKDKKNVEESNPQTEEERALENIIKSREDNKKMFENMFHDSFLLNMSAVEEEVKPVKKKAKKRKIENGTSEDVEMKRRKKPEAEEVEENPVVAVKPKKSKKKVAKSKEEPASIQIMKLINGAFNLNGEKLDTSTSSNESRYGPLDIERIPAKKNYSSSSSSDESEKKYSKPTFCIRERSKEKESTKPTTSSANVAPLKKEVKDEKKKIKKVYFDE